MDKWKYRIMKQQYDDGSEKFVLETDRGSNEQWFSVFRDPDLDKVRKVREERMANNNERKPPVFVE